MKISKYILVIDDDPDINAIVASILRGRGHKTMGCSDPSQALSEIKNLRPDLVILDLHLADLDGGDILKSIRETPRGAEIPVLILSGETQVKEIRRVMNAGADHYMVKPFVPADLISKVEKLLHTGAGGGS